MKEQTPLERLIEQLDLHIQTAYGVGVLDGLTSPLAKQITEIEVVNGKIELCEGLRVIYKGVDISDNNVIKKLRELEHLRDKLINELKLK